MIIGALTSLLLATGGSMAIEPFEILGQIVHLRQTAEREWSHFSEEAGRASLELTFALDDVPEDATITWFQEDVRRSWAIELNGLAVGRLEEDEAPLIGALDLPDGVLRAGENSLRIATSAPEPDDILIGSIQLLASGLDAWVSGSELNVLIEDESGAPIPGRVTVVTRYGALVPLQNSGAGGVVIRTGVAYTPFGRAQLSLPEGEYRVYASRGASYEADSADVTLTMGDHHSIRFSLQQSVVPADYISIDTHVHTRTWSGHGDADVYERVVTVEGEGLGGIVLTEHNRHASAADTARTYALGDAVHLPGNELTTGRGHFNVFPVRLTDSAPSPEVHSWADVQDRVSDALVVVLNHGRDAHAGFVPLGPDRFRALTGERLDSETLPANAMEIWNSSAQRSDPFELFRDWLAMANRGTVLAPIASSDAHDVSRYLIGQGRTWVFCAECTASAGAERAIVDAIREGQVAPSMGLVVELEVNGTRAPTLVKLTADSLVATVRVWGPSWMRADEITLLVNGAPTIGEAVQRPDAGGIKHEVSWVLGDLRHDVTLAVLAKGPDPRLPFWSIPKPYQRVGEEVEAVVAGSSGLVRIDVDGDGTWSSAYGLAQELVFRHGQQLDRLVERLAEYDDAVVLQVASILHGSTGTDDVVSLTDGLVEADRVRMLFETYRLAATSGQSPVD